MIDIFGLVGRGEATPDAGVIMLVQSLGFDADEARRLVDEAAKLTPPTDPGSSTVAESELVE